MRACLPISDLWPKHHIQIMPNFLSPSTLVTLLHANHLPRDVGAWFWLASITLLLVRTIRTLSVLHAHVYLLYHPPTHTHTHCDAQQHRRWNQWKSIVLVPLFFCQGQIWRSRLSLMSRNLGGKYSTISGPHSLLGWFVWWCLCRVCFMGVRVRVCPGVLMVCRVCPRV